MKEGVEGLISVIIPTYNRATILVDALDSVKNQNYRPIEVLIIDDGSTDNTFSAVKKWKEAHAEELFTIEYIKKPNNGAPSARNLGIKMSKGSYVQFLDSDDMLLPFCLEEKFKVLKSSNVEYAYNFSRITDMSGKKIGKNGANPSTVLNQAYIVPYTFNTSGPLINKNVFQKIGFWNENLNGCQEIEYFFRLKKEIGAGICIPKFLTQVRVHKSTSISQNPSKKHAVSAFNVLHIMVESLGKIKKELKGKHYLNESEALSSFAIDVAIKNYKSNCLNNGLEALQIAKKHTHRIQKKFIFSFFQLTAFFSAQTAFALMQKLRGGYSKFHN